MTGLNDSAALSIRVKEFVQSKLFKYDKISQQTKQNFIVHIWRDDEMPCSAASKHKWTNHVQMCEWTANIHRLRDTGELARRPSLLSSFDTKSGGDLDRLRYRGLLSLDERPRRSSLSRLRSGLRSLSSRRRSRSLLRLLQYRYNGYLRNNKLKHIIKHQRIHEHSKHKWISNSASLTLSTDLCYLVVSLFPPIHSVISLQCFDAVGWAAERASGL